MNFTQKTIQKQQETLLPIKSSKKTLNSLRKNHLFHSSSIPILNLTMIAILIQRKQALVMHDQSSLIESILNKKRWVNRYKLSMCRIACKKGMLINIKEGSNHIKKMFL